MNKTSNKLVNTLLGGELDNSEVVILTPSFSYFKRIIKRIKLNSTKFESTILRKKAWWLNLTIIVSSNLKIKFVLIPPGRGVIDAITFLSPYLEKIIFIGTFGGLDKKMRIGDNYIVSKAIYENKSSSWFVKVVSDRLIFIETLNCISEESLEKIKAASNAGIVGFDLELAHLSITAQKFNISVLALITVSDLPSDRPFYDVKLKDRRAVHRSQNKIIDTIIATAKKDNSDFYKILVEDVNTVIS